VHDSKYCSFTHTEHLHTLVGFGHLYPSGGIQSSVTGFRFEDNQPAEVCNEWVYAVHYLKMVVSNVEVSLKELAVTYAEELDGSYCYARPYHYTSDDIVDLRRLHSPHESIYSRSTVYDANPSEMGADMPQKYWEKSSLPADGFHLPSVSNVGSSLDNFLASTALAVCDLAHFHCNCVFSQDLLRHGGPSELLPYLDARTFYSGLLTRLNPSQISHVIHCNNVSRQLMLDSCGIVHLKSSRDPWLLSAGTSDIAPAGNGDKQKLPTIDQLRAIQDNLADNVCCHFVGFPAALLILRYSSDRNALPIELWSVLNELLLK